MEFGALYFSYLVRHALWSDASQWLILIDCEHSKFLVLIKHFLMLQLWLRHVSWEFDLYIYVIFKNNCELIYEEKSSQSSSLITFIALKSLSKAPMNIKTSTFQDLALFPRAFRGPLIPGVYASWLHWIPLTLSPSIMAHVTPMLSLNQRVWKLYSLYCFACCWPENSKRVSYMKAFTQIGMI